MERFGTPHGGSVGAGHKSKSRKGAGPSSTQTLAPACSGSAPREFKKRLKSSTGRLGLLAEIVEELMVDDPSETRQRNLAAAMRGVRLAGEEVASRALPRRIKQLTEELQRDREERARMEAGVEFVSADEGSDLPSVSGDECH